MTNHSHTPAAKASTSPKQPGDDPRTQAEKFADLARELECDESEEGFDERLKAVAGSFKHTSGKWTVERGKSEVGYKARFTPSGYGPERNVSGFETEEAAADWIASTRHVAAEDKA